MYLYPIYFILHIESQVKPSYIVTHQHLSCLSFGDKNSLPFSQIKTYGFLLALTPDMPYRYQNQQHFSNHHHIKMLFSIIFYMHQHQQQLHFGHTVLQSTQTAQQIIETLIEGVWDEIKANQLLAHIPQHLYNETMCPIHEMFFAANIPEPICQPCSMDLQSDVPKISIDNMAPKQMKRQKKSPAKDRQSASPKSNLSRLKKRLSKMSSSNKNDQLLARPKRPPPQVVPLDSTPDQIQTEQLTIIRKQKAYEENQRNKAKADKQAKQHRLQQSRRAVQQTYANGYTFDLDGSVLQSELVDTDKMTIHTIKLHAARLYHLKNKDPSKIQKQTLNIKPRGPSRQKYNTIDLNNQAPIPTFAVEQVDSKKIAKYSKLNRHDFAMMHGRRFSPWNQRQLSKPQSKQKQDSFQTLDLTSQRQSVIGSQRLIESHNTSATFMTNKFTLPKLRGRYNVLDRYSSLDAKSGIVSKVH